MNLFRNRYMRATIGMAVVLAVGAIIYNRFFAVEEGELLRPLRIAASRVIHARSDSDRRNAAESCLLFANELAQQPGVLGITGALYHVALTPLAAMQRSIDIPSPSEVDQMATEDVLATAQLLLMTYRYEPADQLVELALNRDDEFRTDALKLAVSVRFEIGRDRDVLLHCDELISKDPYDPQFYRVQMMVHRNHGRWDNFVPAAEKAVQLTQPTDWVLMVELADGYTHLGLTQKARTIVNQLKRHEPGLLSRAPVMHANLLLQEGESAKAASIVDSLLQANPNDDEALLVKGKMQVAEGDFQDAVQTFETLLAVLPSDEQVYYQLGQAYARSGDSDKAKLMLTKHRQVLDAKVRLYKLEQQASMEPHNEQVRAELVRSYREIGLDELADFWARSAGITQAKTP